MTGVFGVYPQKARSTMNILFRGLKGNEQRGQNATGFSIRRKENSENIIMHKNFGDTAMVLNHDIMDLAGHPYVAIGTVDDVTEESTLRRDLAPIKVKNDKYQLSIAMDGRIINSDELRREIDYDFLTNNEAETLGVLFFKNLLETRDEWEGAKLTMQQLDRSSFYSAVMLINDGNETKLIGLRDKRGICPLSIGVKDSTYVISSETRGLDLCYIPFERFVRPGEMIVVSKEGLKIEQIMKSEPRYCIFDPVYYLAPDALFEADPFDPTKTQLVFDVRKNLGRKLYERYGPLGDFVTYVSESGKGVGFGYAEASGLFLDEVLFKTTRIKRTFTMKDQEERMLEAQLKLNPVRSKIVGKKVSIGDDSIVKGTVSYGYMKTLFTMCDPELIYYIISYSPIRAASLKDFTTNKRNLLNKFQILAAFDYRDKSVDEINQYVSSKLADNLGIRKNKINVCYNTRKNVIDAVGLPKENLCTACADGKYCLPLAQELVKELGINFPEYVE